GFAVIGTLLSVFAVRDTRRFVQLELDDHRDHTGESSNLPFKQVFAQTSWKDRTLLAVSQAGLVNNLVFGVSWGLFTLYFASFQLNVNEIGFLKSLHPAIWGILQLGTGSLSDRVGRKSLIYSGMIIQAAGIWVVLFASNTLGWIAGMSLLGIGTALVYPTLLAAISDVAHPQWRATSLGVYRFWRDLGFVFGAIGIGFLADIFGIGLAIHSAAWIALASGIFVILVMRETRRKERSDRDPR
ncbi:MAG TPA: MFS transporter, partial [Nitrososphaera sp.]|nr:MFS transporter [Nitrososphaera sp.]